LNYKPFLQSEAGQGYNHTTKPQNYMDETQPLEQQCKSGSFKLSQCDLMLPTAKTSQNIDGKSTIGAVCYKEMVLTDSFKKFTIRTQHPP